jgi:D-3-phosphoglycerate dehydrogenase/(S)-sulfolactate dehydrogenase
MAQLKVLVSDKLSDAGLGILQSFPGLEVDYKPGLDESALREIIGAFDGLVIRSGSKVSAHVIAAAHRLKVIGRAGIGVDNVDIPAASKKGIIVMNTPTGNAVTTAEHAITLMLSIARKIPQATASMKAGKWEKTRFEGREISGKTLGVLGLGNIGRIVANRAQGLNMSVIGFDPVLSSERAREIGVELVSVEELFRRADVITCHTPLTPETRNLLDAEAFAKMKPGVLIVNAARGGIVDEAALADAIVSGKVGGAALDVFVEEPPSPDHPLLKLDNVVVTPHLGASTAEAQERVALEICEQVARYLTSGEIRNALNVPSLSREAAAKLGPYLVLARKLGLLLGQLKPVDVREVRVTCTGDAGELGARPIANVALAGYLERHVDIPVNQVSAPHEARARGIALVEVVEPAVKLGFASTVCVTVSGADGVHNARGTLSHSGDPRLVQLDGYELDAVIDGTVVLVHNEDKPGVIGKIGTILGSRGINVSRMQLGLDKASRQALSLWNVDSAVSEPALDELRKIDNMRSISVVSL